MEEHLKQSFAASCIDLKEAIGNLGMVLPLRYPTMDRETILKRFEDDFINFIKNVGDDYHDLYIYARNQKRRLLMQFDVEGYKSTKENRILERTWKDFEDIYLLITGKRRLRM